EARVPTPSYKLGFGFEDRVVSLLERAGFMLKVDSTLDHVHKVDFAILSFPGNLSHDSVGVQMTTFRGLQEKLDRFVTVNRGNRKFRRYLYLEIEPDLDFEY